jgi:hypothetical protein
MSGLLRLTALVALYLHLSHGALYQDTAELRGKTYDYIVVGGIF